MAESGPPLATKCKRLPFRGLFHLRKGKIATEIADNTLKICDDRRTRRQYEKSPEAG